MSSLIIRYMKKLLLGGLCLATLATACAPQVADNEYLVTGTVTGIPDSTVITLRRLEGTLLQETVRDTVIGGRFELRDTVSSPLRLTLMAQGKGFPNTWLNVWVAPGQHIKVGGDGPLFPLWDVKSDITEQQEENRFVAYTREPFQKALEYNVQETAFLKQLLSEEHREDKDFKKTIWSKVDSIRRLAMPFELEKAKLEVEYMKTAPVSQAWLSRLETNAKTVKAVALMPFYRDYGVLDEPLKALYQSLPDSVKQTQEAQVAYHALFPPQRVQVGDDMADGTLYDADGNEHRLAEFKGKYILLDFWSQGCGPCRAAIPELEEVEAMYTGRLVVVSISTDTESRWKKYLQENKLPGIQWNELRNDDGGLEARYGVQGVPHYVLIAPDGKVKDAWVGYGKGVIKDNLKAHIK